jgi:hypothetical protein
MKPIKKFMKYLERELPKGYWAKCTDGEKVIILNDKGYVYLFHKQEIEEDFVCCCSLINIIIKESM